MGDNNILVTKWASYNEADKAPQSFGGLGGFFSDGMRWNDYLRAFEKDAHKYAEAIRKSIIELKIKECGPWHQESENGAPIFSDGTAATFSYRAWGDLLAAIWATEESKDYNYMDFYC